VIREDPAHAVRILEALVEQGEKHRKYDTPEKRWVGSRPLEDALIEGAKAVLDKWNKVLAYQQIAEDSITGRGTPQDAYSTERVAETWDNRVGEAAEFICALAKAYAPRMKEAGMEVPE